MSSPSDWDRAAKIAFEAYEDALRSGADIEWAVTLATAQMRSIVPTATESDVRRNLSLLLAEKRLAERTASEAAPLLRSAGERR
jgi:hypothetical protein